MKKQMGKNKFFISLAAGALLVSGIGLIGVTAYGNSKNGQDVNGQIKSLLEKLRVASQNELITGQTAVTPRGKVFTGQSAEKMKNLNDQTQKQIDDLIARPENERQSAIAEIKRFAKKQDISVNYKHTSKSSYNANVPVEIYYVDSDQYEVDTRTNKIIQFGPRPFAAGEQQTKIFDTTARYSEKELEGMARQFISENASDVKLENLTQKKANKDDINYFFRWEDFSREVEEMHLFIQVGFSRGGSLLSYTNSLGL